MVIEGIGGAGNELWVVPVLKPVKPGDRRPRTDLSFEEKKRQLPQLLGKLSSEAQASLGENLIPFFEELSLLGISSHEATAFLKEPAFHGWDAAAHYIGAMPTGIRQLHEVLEKVADKRLPSFDDRIYLELAGTLLNHARHEVQERGAGDIKNIDELKQSARAIEANLKSAATVAIVKT